MEINVGTPDRLARMVAGIALLALGGAILAGVLGEGSVLGVLVAVVGAVLLGTGATRMCPIYQLLGVDTCSR